MEIFRFSILPLAETERREAFKEAVNNCPLCGEHLLFRYDNDYLCNTIHEESSCEKCQLTIREDHFDLQ